MSEPPRLLIAEDDDSTRALLTQFFTRKGFVVTAVANGRLAVEAAQANRFDVAVFDVMMPVMTGLEALESLRASGSTLPIVVATALGAPDDVVRGLAAGADDYVSKPFDLAVLHARVQLQLRRARAAPPSPPPQTATAAFRVEKGAVVDARYKLIEPIGEGSFGVVWRAHHRGLETDVAFKVLRPHAKSGTERLEPMNSRGERVESDYGERNDELRLEGVRAARVQHDNAVRVYDVGALPDGTAYLVMELLDGPTIEDILREERVLSIPRAVSILLPVLDALAAAHAQHVIHRDIKPANVLLHRTKSGAQVIKVLDFGVAKLVDGGDHPGDSPGKGPGGQSNRFIAGSPAYLAPERLRGLPYDGRSDVYSVGIMLFEMLVGRVPFVSLDGDMMQVALAHLKQKHEPPSRLNPLLPPAVDDVVARLLEKEPAHRPDARRAADLIADLLDVAVDPS